MSLNKNEREISFESIYPILFSVVITIILYFKLNFSLIFKEFNNLLNGTITFSSIIIGFIGVLLGILLSIKDSEIVQEIYRDTKREILIGYFKSSLISGTILVALSCVLYYVDDMKQIHIFHDKSLAEISVLAWFAIYIFFILSSYRIINIMMRIILKAPEATNKKPEMEKIDLETERKLQKKYKVQKNRE